MVSGFHIDRVDANVVPVQNAKPGRYDFLIIADIHTAHILRDGGIHGRHDFQMRDRGIALDGKQRVDPFIRDPVAHRHIADADRGEALSP